jgi:Spy/CpxP family protein refolding chaperone
MYDAIQPTEEQKAKIDKILDKYSMLNIEAGEAFRKNFETRMEKFRNEIEANLTPEQAVYLKKLDEQRKVMVRVRRRPNFDHFNEHHDSTETN